MALFKDTTFGFLMRNISGGRLFPYEDYYNEELRESWFNAGQIKDEDIRTSTTDSPSYLTSGFYKIEKGKAYPLHYTCEETKYVISGQIDVLDEATGVTHHLVPGDFAFFYVGSKVQFSTKSAGLAFYAVTRPVKAAHPNLAGREEVVQSKSKL
ncbi:hypothetical protein D6C83_06041 [Aureobasidium pullulans]|uniref:(S)-ureidoglycine aminohydrolase cupin domain-containing protein n=1 Tax=Aureobasidium pullulans TaxID=5580 RepID=A0A4V4LGJ7_AURPU|nr:hypothetical protein D6C83_06041 [Aureobasidium pullulans]